MTEAQRLERVCQYQEARIKELEGKKAELDQELQQARDTLGIVQSRAGSMEPGGLQAGGEASAKKYRGRAATLF